MESKQVAAGTVSTWEPWNTPSDGQHSKAGSLTPIRERSRVGTSRWLARTRTECTIKQDKHGWKPSTTTKRVLIPFVIVSLGLAGALEGLAQRSQRNGGLALSTSSDSIPGLAKFSYLFLPTIIAVVYSIWWTWVDLDVKRTQPWLELSRPDGATAENSLLLDYPYDFVAFVPLKAARKRHWNVFISGTAMMIIFWVLTPLQSAIFGSGPVIVRRSVAIAAKSQLIPVGEQADAIDPILLHRAFGAKYLGQSYPPFTTAEYAFRPFEVMSSIAAPLEAQNITGATTMYYADLDCWPAEVEQSPIPNTYNFQNGRGCNSTVHPLQLNPNSYRYKLVYMGYHDSPYALDAISGPECPRKTAEHQFLGVMMERTEDADRPEMTALFCETSYWKQNVTVTVSGDNFVPDSSSIRRLSSPEPLSAEEYNSTGLEFLLGSGHSSVERVRDYPADELLSHEDRVNGTGLAVPLDCLVPFAIDDVNRTMTDFLDEEFMKDRFKAAHKTMFALAINRLQSKSAAVASEEPINGYQTIILHGVIVSRLFSAIVEGLLIGLGLSAIALCILNSRLESKLSHDPASLGDLINVVRDSTQLLECFKSKDDMDEMELSRAFSNQNIRLQLQCGCQNPSGLTSIVILRPDGRRLFEARSPPSAPGHGLTRVSTGHYKPVGPVVLRRDVGTIFIFTLMGITVALFYLKHNERQQGGLTRPSDSFEVLQILTSYIPTIIATLIEPYWVLVNRLLCILQPFRGLLTGRKHENSSIETRYTSVPPQLVIWRAIRTGHFLLALVCIIALLSNVLTIGFGGLFNVEPVRPFHQVALGYTVGAEFNADALKSDAFNLNVRKSFYADHFLATLANVSGGLPLPPWTTKDFYFQPFQPAGVAVVQVNDTLSGRTRGFGAEISCEPLEFTDDPHILDVSPFIDKYSIPKEYNCSDNFNIDPSGLRFSGLEGGTVHGPVAREEVVWKICPKVWLSVYSRTTNDFVQPKTNATGQRNYTEDLMAVACYPQFKTGLFDVMVDADGIVLSAERATNLTSELEYPQSKNHTDILLDMITDKWNSDQGWHNVTVSRNWLDYIVQKASNTSSFLDPLEPVPNHDFVIKYTKDILQRHLPVILAFNPILFANDTNASSADPELQSTFEGILHTFDTRIFMDDLAFIISATILALNVAVACAVYGWSVRFFLPRMPTTIGSILAYLAPSRALREYVGPRSTARAVTEEGGKKLEKTFSFGRYVGDDGKAHIGIEFSQYVVPLDLAALKEGDLKRTDSAVWRFRVRFWRGWRRGNEPRGPWL